MEDTQLVTPEKEKSMHAYISFSFFGLYLFLLSQLE